MKYNDYSDLKNGLKKLPVSWYPDLIGTMIRAVYKKKIFLPGKMSEFIRILEEKEGMDKP